MAAVPPLCGVQQEVRRAGLVNHGLPAGAAGKGAAHSLGPGNPVVET
ncbi:MAG: hypothetical protein ABSF29_02110 [Tepidisphaeraceae bacterium]|jgi:hypothetical protein